MKTLKLITLIAIIALALPACSGGESDAPQEEGKLACAAMPGLPSGMLGCTKPVNGYVCADVSGLPAGMLGCYPAKN